MELDGADVVVIGGGVVGMASTYFIAKRGMEVMLLDKGVPGWEASGRNGGHAGSGFDEVSRVNSAMWEGLEEELGASMEYVQGGSLRIAMSEEDVVLHDKAIENGRRVGVDVRKLDLREMQEILPGVTEKALSGMFNPIGAQANPQLTSQAWLWALSRVGVRVRENTLVTGIGVEDGHVTHVDTISGRIKAEKIVNAAGPWAHIVNEMAGRTMPPRPVLIEMLCTLPLPFITRATFSGNILYCRQAASGHLHFGGWNVITKDLRQDDTKETSSLVTGDVAKRFVEMVPGLGHARVIRTWAGVIARMPDDEPCIDKLDGPQGMFVNMGFGGGGFAFSPVAGKIMSDLVVDGETSLDISPYSANKLAGIGDFETEARDPV